MREIEFRGFSVNFKKWCYGYLGDGLNFKGNDGLFIKTKGDCVVLEVHPKSVGQFTGLKDCEGMRIFRKDIITDNVGREWVIDYLESKASFIFRWMKDKKQFCIFSDFNKRQLPLKITGNTYEEKK